jgi:hypothetical protein
MLLNKNYFKYFITFFAAKEKNIVFSLALIPMLCLLDRLGADQWVINIPFRINK